MFFGCILSDSSCSLDYLLFGWHFVKALFASLIIRLFQLAFSAGTVFFSRNKSAGTMFRLVFSANGAIMMFRCRRTILRGHHSFYFLLRQEAIKFGIALY